jgi:ubiquinone biosynthesis protein COQ9
VQTREDNKPRKLITSAFMHDMSMAVLEKDGKNKKSKKSSGKKKVKHQNLNSSFLMFVPNSKYFNNTQNSHVSNGKEGRGVKKSAHSLNIKHSVKIDPKFVMMDLIWTIDSAYDKYLLKVLESKVVMIGDTEKKVTLIRNLRNSKLLWSTG